MISWSPYAIVSLYRAFSSSQNIISPLLATIPAYFGKFSLAWPAIITLVYTKELRKKMKREKEKKVITMVRKFYNTKKLISLIKINLFCLLN